MTTPLTHTQLHTAETNIKTALEAHTGHTFQHLTIIKDRTGEHAADITISLPLQELAPLLLDSHQQYIGAPKETSAQ